MEVLGYCAFHDTELNTLAALLSGDWTRQAHRTAAARGVGPALRRSSSGGPALRSSGAQRWPVHCAQRAAMCSERVACRAAGGLRGQRRSLPGGLSLSFMLCYAVLCYALFCCAVLCYAMQCYAMLCSVLLCCAVLCHAMPCYAMLCCAVLCYAMLCHVQADFSLGFMSRNYIEATETTSCLHLLLLLTSSTSSSSAHTLHLHLLRPAPRRAARAVCCSALCHCGPRVSRGRRS